MDWHHLIERLSEYDLHLFNIGGSEISVSSALKLVVFGFALHWIARRVRRWTVERALARSQLDAGTRQAVGGIVHYTVVVVGLVMILQNAGLNLSAFSVVAGAVGVGVGFGLQNIISNFVSGLIIMLERPIKVGDRIEIGSIEGVVTDIGARRTTILTNDGMSTLIPNQRFILDNVVNQVYDETPVRLRVAVQVVSGTDPELMQQLLLDAAFAHEQVLKEPTPQAIMTLVGGPASAYELAVWHEPRGPRRQDLASDLAKSIARLLRAHDIKGA